MEANQKAKVGEISWLVLYLSMLGRQTENRHHVLGLCFFVICLNDCFRVMTILHQYVGCGGRHVYRTVN